MRRLAPLKTLALLLAFAPRLALAQAAPEGQPAPPTTTLPTTEVIGTTPLLGVGISRDKLPETTQSLTPGDLTRQGPANLTQTLNERVPGVTTADVAASPFQPDLFFRGFDASPVIGTPQGLAVYQNGVRINEPFGDNVNWDLVPDFAINRSNLFTANPVFGLNALGGAIALEMKNGFTNSGGQAELSGGSFGQIQSTLEYGAHVGNFASYIGGKVVSQEGYREHSSSSLHQLYGDLGAMGEAATVHVNFTGASNLINSVGPVPVELLDQSRAAVYTTPQTARNNLAFLSANGSYSFTDTLSLQGVAYYRSFNQQVANGNTSDAQPCTTPANTLCLGNGTTVLFDTQGQPIPNFLNGAPAGELDDTSTHSTGIGGSLQMTETGQLLDRGNHFILGGSIDHGDVNFRTSSELGIIQPNLLVSGAGFFIDQPDGEIAPVNLDTTNTYYGLYATDTLDVTEKLAVTASGRYNLALIRLTDLAGTQLNGDHHFSHFNPAIGATYKVLPNLTAFAGFSEANRAPTPGELACADPARPCVLDNFLVSDPNLQQVVTHTYELGLRGGFAPVEEGKITWNVSLYRTDSFDDILNVPSELTGHGFFTNVGTTRRQGVDAGLNYRSPHWFAYLGYSYLDATFQSPVTLSSPNNPFADANGNIFVKPGDRLPSLPQHQVKAGADYNLTEDWKVGGDLIIASDQFLRGDEANQNPTLPGYFVVNLHTSYQVTDNVELFGIINNLFNRQYDTFGAFFQTDQIPFLNLSDPRTVTPAAPLGIFVGMRVTF